MSVDEVQEKLLIRLRTSAFPSTEAERTTVGLGTIVHVAPQNLHVTTRETGKELVKACPNALPFGPEGLSISDIRPAKLILTDNVHMFAMKGKTDMQNVECVQQ